MKSQTSLLNKTLLSHFTGTIFWLTIVFMALNIIALPLSIWIVTFDRDFYPDYQIPENFLFQIASGQLIIGMIFTAFLAMFLLNYLNDESSSDFMHSLPVKRTALLVHVLLTGITAIVVPLVISVVILLIERMIFIPEIAVTDIGKWLIYALFAHFVVFAIAIFTGFLVNGIFLHMQVIILALFLPLAVWGLTFAAANVLYDGISSSFIEHSELVLNATFPYIAVTQLYDGINTPLSLVWAAAAILLIVLSFVLYKYRRNEKVTASFNFVWLKEILTAVTTIAGMLAVGASVSLLIPVSPAVSIFGFAVGAIVAYLIVEMFFQNSVKIQFSWKSIVFTVLVIIIFWLVFLIGWTKYVNDVPSEEEVASVYIADDYMYYTSDSLDEYFEEGFLFNDDEKVIESAIKAHEAAIEDKSFPNIYTGDETARLEFQYKMEDGSVMNRTFQTLQNDSEAVQITKQLNSDRYNINADFLENIKHHPEMTELWLFNNTLRADRSLIEDYKNHSAQLMDYNSYITNETGRIEASANYENNYESGMSSIYNEAVLKRIAESDLLMEEILYLNQSSEMFIADIPADELEIFFNDYKELNIRELADKHEFENLSEEQKTDIISQVNDGELAPEGSKLLIYSYPDYTESEEDYPAEMDFSILAIK